MHHQFWTILSWKKGKRWKTDPISRGSSGISFAVSWIGGERSSSSVERDEKHHGWFQLGKTHLWGWKTPQLMNQRRLKGRVWRVAKCCNLNYHSMKQMTRTWRNIHFFAGSGTYQVSGAGHCCWEFWWFDQSRPWIYNWILWRFLKMRAPRKVTFEMDHGGFS